MNATNTSAVYALFRYVPGLNITNLAVKHSFDTKDIDLITKFCAGQPKTPNGTATLCQTGFYGYLLNFKANTVFSSLFVLTLMLYLIAWLATRRSGWFSLAMMLGCALEIAGYVGRSWSKHDQFDNIPFLMQICCLTIGPAFMAAGLYVCLRRIVQCYGSMFSRIPPEWYIRIFIPCDIVSLILQGVGGGIAAHAFKHGGRLRYGNDVMLAGLAFQLFTMFLFVVASLDFASRVYQSYRRHGHQVLEQDEAVIMIRKSTPFKGFVGALSLATTCIFIRCAFRVAELSGGWTGPLMRDQTLFIVFEGSMIVIAALALALFNPIFCFKETPVGPGHWNLEKI